MAAKALLLAALAATALAACPSNNTGWFQFSGSGTTGLEFTLVLNQRNRSLAATRCGECGGHLATVVSAAHNNFLLRTVAKTTTGPIPPAWLGLRRTTVPGVGDPLGLFVWDSGSTSTYRNWLSNTQTTEPNFFGGNEYCVRMGHRLYPASDPGEWNDAVCSETSSFFCQRQIQSTTTTTTTTTSTTSTTTSTTSSFVDVPSPSSSSTSTTTTTAPTTTPTSTPTTTPTSTPTTTPTSTPTTTPTSTPTSTPTTTPTTTTTTTTTTTSSSSSSSNGSPTPYETLLLQDNWSKYGQCFYKYFGKGSRVGQTANRNWGDAERFCRRIDLPDGGGTVRIRAHLVSISSMGENTFVDQLRTSSDIGRPARPFWTGGVSYQWYASMFNKTSRRRRDAPVTDFVWAEGGAVTYTNWIVDGDYVEPNNLNGREKCIAMGHIAIGQSDEWNDAECRLRRHFVCEYCMMQE